MKNSTQKSGNGLVHFKRIWKSIRLSRVKYVSGLIYEEINQAYKAWREIQLEAHSARLIDQAVRPLTPEATVRTIPWPSADPSGSLAYKGHLFNLVVTFLVFKIADTSIFFNRMERPLQHLQRPTDKQQHK